MLILIFHYYFFSWWNWKNYPTLPTGIWFICW